MIDTPSITLAFAAGAISFLSPCCLPLVPGYLAAVTGGHTHSGDARFDRVVIGRSLIFVGSFSSVFIALGLTATALGSFLFKNQEILSTISGIAIIAMGVLFVASAFVVRLNREWRPPALARRAGGPAVTGVAFAIAWTPCVGPALGAILGLAATQQSAARGAGLLAVYSAGLAIPFLFCALAFDRSQRAFAPLRRHRMAIQVVGGLILIVMGVLVASGELFRLNIEVQQFLSRLGLNFFQSF